MRRALQIHHQDDVAVALVPLAAGEACEGVVLPGAIPAGHKFALRRIAAGEAVRKYGLPIGQATAEIEPGAHVHTHNLRTRLSGQECYCYAPDVAPLAPLAPDTFDGYPRADGRAGVRNELWILPTVGCVNDVARALERKAQALVGGAVEGAYAFPHPYGCSQMSEDQENTRRILADLAAHPNAGGVLVLGLGCENSGVAEIRARMGAFDGSRVRFLVCQDSADELAEGFALLRELADRMRADRREPIPASRLIVGLKCGGSDGLSGVTANPVIGAYSDLLVAQGGGTILTEVPEMFGAETLLMARCASEAVFRRTVELINGFKRYYEENRQVVYENPSPGNKAGGITTLEEKALGCTQKSGSAPVSDVLAYGARAGGGGLSLLCAPGNDLVASTALAAAGAQIVLFSTGRGTPFACPVPTVKISSNTPLAERKPGWIDFDAGALLLDGDRAACADRLRRLVLAIASGKHTRAEENGYHDLAIFKTGVTL